MSEWDEISEPVGHIENVTQTLDSPRDLPEGTRENLTGGTWAGASLSRVNPAIERMRADPKSQDRIPPGEPERIDSSPLAAASGTVEDLRFYEQRGDIPGKSQDRIPPAEVNPEQELLQEREELKQRLDQILRNTPPWPGGPRNLSDLGFVEPSKPEPYRPEAPTDPSALGRLAITPQSVMAVGEGLANRAQSLYGRLEDIETGKTPIYPQDVGHLVSPSVTAGTTRALRAGAEFGETELGAFGARPSPFRFIDNPRARILIEEGAKAGKSDAEIATAIEKLGGLPQGTIKPQMVQIRRAELVASKRTVTRSVWSPEMQRTVKALTNEYGAEHGFIKRVIAEFRKRFPDFKGTDNTIVGAISRERLERAAGEQGGKMMRLGGPTESQRMRAAWPLVGVRTGVSEESRL